MTKGLTRTSFENAENLERGIQSMAENRRQHILKHAAEEPLPPICADQSIVDVKDVNGCFVKGMTERLAPSFEALKTMKQGDGCKVQSLQPHQLTVHELARLFAARSLEEMKQHRGLLIWHNTGSGKTATAAGICLAYLTSSGPRRRIAIVTTPANERDNDLAIYAGNMLMFYPQYATEVFGTVPAKPWTMAAFRDKNSIFRRWADGAGKKSLTSKVSTFTFTTLASRLGVGKKYGYQGLANPDPEWLVKDNGGVVIMDESQSLFKPQSAYAGAAKGLAEYLVKPEVIKKVTMYAMSATPGESVPEFTEILSMVRRADQRPFTVNDAARPDAFRGLVSYVDIRSDITRYGIVKDPLSGTMGGRDIEVQMSPRYYLGFLKAVSKHDEDFTYEKLPESKKKQFLAKAKAAGNSLSKAQASYFTADELEKLQKTRPIPMAVVVDSGVRVVSPKIVALLKYALELPGKQFVYIPDIPPFSTLKTVAALLNTLGYKQITPKETKKSSDADTGKSGRHVVPMPPGKRFILYKTGTVNKHAQDEAHLNAYKGFFDSKENLNGATCKLMLATEDHYQGLDLQALRGVHIVSPLFNDVSDRQARGRALRLCGHVGLPLDQQNVALYMYYSIPPSAQSMDFKALAEQYGKTQSVRAGIMELEETHREIMALGKLRFQSGKPVRGINQYARANAIRRGMSLKEFENCLKGMSIDCALYKSAYHHRDPFQCNACSTKPYRPEEDPLHSTTGTPAKNSRTGTPRISNSLPALTSLTNYNNDNNNNNNNDNDDHNNNNDDVPPPPSKHANQHRRTVFQDVRIVPRSSSTYYPPTRR